MAAHVESQPSARVRELEKQLAQVKLERDELRNDIEALCLKEGSSIFDRRWVSPSFSCCFRFMTCWSAWSCHTS